MSPVSLISPSSSSERSPLPSPVSVPGLMSPMSLISPSSSETSESEQSGCATEDEDFSLLEQDEEGSGEDAPWRPWE